jgi:serine/threonine protein kinase
VGAQRDEERTILPPALLELVLRLLDEGREPSRAAILERHAGSDEQVERALHAWTRYRELMHACQRGRHAGPHLKPGSELGDFEIEDLLGFGGMSVVYRARQRSLGDRPVALKVFLADTASDPLHLDRFRREARLAAQVAHSHLAQVLGAGEERGVLYYAMRLVEGETLQRALVRLQEQRSERPELLRSPEHVRACTRIAQQVASATAAIHRHGLVHRDVKPSNVMLEGPPAAALEGLKRPAVVIDFGLIRPQGRSDLTRHDSGAGTEAFASPEARLGAQVDARADVFSTGVLLHDLLAGRLATERPIAAAGLPEVRELNPAVPADLAAVVAKAVQPLEAARYEDGAELQEDLDRFLSHRPVRARRMAPLHAARLWILRDPFRALRRTAAALTVVVAAIVLAMFGRAALDAARIGRRALEDEMSGRLADAVAGYARLELSPVPASLLPGFEPIVERARRHGSRDPDLQPFQEIVRLLTSPPGDALDRSLYRLGELFEERLDADPCFLPSIAHLLRSQRDEVAASVVRQLALLLYLSPYPPEECISSELTREQLFGHERGLRPALEALVERAKRGGSRKASCAALAALGGLPCAEGIEFSWTVWSDERRSQEEHALAAAQLARIVHAYRRSFRGRPWPSSILAQSADWTGRASALVLSNSLARAGIATRNDSLAARELILALRDLGRAPALHELLPDLAFASRGEGFRHVLRDVAASGDPKALDLLEELAVDILEARTVDGWAEVGCGLGLAGGTDAAARLDELARRAPDEAAKTLRASFRIGADSRAARWNGFETHVDPDSHLSGAAARKPFRLSDPPAGSVADEPQLPDRFRRRNLRMGWAAVDFGDPAAPVRGSPVEVEGECVRWESQSGTPVPEQLEARRDWRPLHRDQGPYLVFPGATRSFARFTTPARRDYSGATLILDHYYSNRPGLPSQGEATVAIHVNGAQVERVDVPSTVPCAHMVHVPAQLACDVESFVVTIELLHATTTYRLERLYVEFQ